MKKKEPNNALIAIVLMVKNEAGSIVSTLSSFMHGGIRDFFIFDTGSTDNTIELAESFFKQHQLHGCVKQEPFIDFSSSRNRALELAEQQLPNTTFFLMPDAEWYIHNAPALLEFCKQEQHKDTPIYTITIKMNAIEFTTARLFRATSCIRFKGVVHEAATTIATIKVPDPVYIEVKASSYGVEKSQQRWKQDLILLLNEYKNNPQDPRNTFYLAQTYECLDDFDNAYHYYQMRSQLTGWDEENFITLVRLGNLATKVKQTDNLPGWATGMDYYLKAFASRPHRIEPLLLLADHYWPDNIQACYLFAQYAYDKPYPAHDQLFIDREAYQYTRYEIMSRCAWHMGEFALGEKATLLALQARPGVEHLLNNLALYQKKLNEKTVTLTATLD